MADEFDVEAMLEETYKRKEKNGDYEKRRDRNEEERDDRGKRKRSKDRERKRSRSPRENESRHQTQKIRENEGSESRRGKRDEDRGRHTDRVEKNRDNREKEESGYKGRDRERQVDRHADRQGDRQADRQGDRQADRQGDRGFERHSDRQGDRYRGRGGRGGGGRSPERNAGSPSGMHNRGGDRRRYGRQMSVSPVREPEPELTPEERDARTVFCMQLAARIRPRDLEEFFSAVGKVRDVRLILDNKSHRSKGIAYIEFRDVESVALAIGLSGQRLLGVPIIVQPSHAERNRLASAQAAALKAATTGPMKLYVGSLHYNITEEMLRGIFEPFGKLVDLKLMRDHQSGRSAGYGFLTYQNSEDAKKAMDQLNGFELAGRSIKIGTVIDRTGEESGTSFDVDEMDRYGFGLGPTGRLQLMAKLAEGTGMQLPAAATNALNAPPPAVVAAPPIATQCFMLSNMFDPARETGTGWETELRDDVIEECNKHGGVLHIYVDRASPEGNIYVKCPSLTAAAASVNALHGRYFAGKVITAAYVPLPNYHSLFPDSIRASQFVMPSTARSAL